jgi:Ca-activated chloride channel family protein
MESIMSEQTPQPIDADDPGLTAYALGELLDNEAARYAAAVAASAELQAIVAEIQAEARILSDELCLEPTVLVSAERRAEILAQADCAASASVPRKRFLGISRRAMAAAASVLLVPGAWYAFHAAFPRVQLPTVFARQETASADYYFGDDVQYFPAHPGSVAELLAYKSKREAALKNEASPQDGGRTVGGVSIHNQQPKGSKADNNHLAQPVVAVPTQTFSRREAEDVAALGIKRSRFSVYDSTEEKLASKSPQASVVPRPGAMPGLKIQTKSDPYLGVPFKLSEASRGSAVSPGMTVARSDRFGLGDIPANPTPNNRGLAEIKHSKPTTFDFTDESLNGIRDESLAVGLRMQPAEPTSGEAYQPIFENAFITPQEQQLSTFSIDVDTASYANLRRFLQSGQLPPPDAVRIEELVNYFAYQYPQPQDGRPFSVQTDIAACPWQPDHQLVRIGLKGKEIPKEQRLPTNLVFLVDVSGSMSSQNKLPLVRESLTTLVKQLDERDKVAIVTYAGEAGVRLPSTSVAQREVVLAAIAGLGAGGSTNGAAGINTAYDIAAQEFLEKGTNRVILCTDGDFNVGVTSDNALVQMIQTRAKGGVFLSVFGFGMGNLKDAKLEQLADKGNGQYGYIDDQQEANKVFVQELMGTLVTIAKDVKIQVDFNKDVVASYRLVGYENRVMAAEDFHDDKKDAGEIGAGHTVTALYEITPVKDFVANKETRWLTVKLRYKQPEAATSVLFENPLVGQPGQLKLASSDFQFAASVAACGMLLRHSQYAGQANWSLIKELAQSGLSHDPHGHRRAFLGLVAQAESLMGQVHPVTPPAPDSTVGGKYKSLLRRLHVPADTEKYGQFKELGHSEMKSYAGSENLPAGYWVYVAPYWYLWAESTQKVAN